MHKEDFYLRSKLIILFSLVFIAFSGCASKKSDEGYYDRANKASKEALNKLDKE